MSGGEDRPGRRVRRRVVYRGNVQGVFFRATSREISRAFVVVGFVRNLPDGGVELEAEGAAEQVETFLLSVERHFAGNITGIDVGELDPRQSETAFDIAY